MMEANMNSKEEIMIIEDDSNEVPTKKEQPEKRIARQRKGIDPNAPVLPKNGYVRFYNTHKGEVKLSNPEASYPEISKLIAQKWATLAAEDKQKYLDEAERDRRQYQEQMAIYKKTDTYKEFQRKEAMIAKKAKLAAQKKKVARDESKSSGVDVMIFTDNFLQHNRQRETELRELRKETIELEEQNATLAKHVENLKSSVAKLEVESVQQRNSNSSFRSHLDKLRNALAKALTQLSVPGGCEEITNESVDTFLINLSKNVEDGMADEQLVSELRKIINKINFKSLEKL